MIMGHQLAMILVNVVELLFPQLIASPAFGL